MKRKLILMAALLVSFSTGIVGRAQIAAPPPAPEVQIRSSAELDQMLGPVALYPDPLLGQILPAATLPSEIVLADRYVNGGGDPNLIDQQPWDPSVKALARYPALLKWMDDNLAWATALGQAFLEQQQDVMDSIQRLRAQAQALGNLQSTPQENVVADGGTIEILPANPDVIYPPVYQPDVVYVQRAFGSPFISFGVGLRVGAWLDHDFDWHNHDLIVWGHDRPRPADWWSRRPSERPRVEVAHTTVWQPRSHPAPATRNLDRGWNPPQVRSTVTTIGAQPRPAEGPRQRPATVAPGRSTVTVIGSPSRPAEVSRPRPATGALIGVQSAHQTQQFSSRGQASRQATQSRPAAPPAHASAPSHSAAPSHPTGGGRH